MNISKIFYTGLETQTLHLFNDKKYFEVVGCAEIEYLTRDTYNPFNFFVKRLYSSRFERKSSTISEFFFYILTKYTRFLTTSFSKKYFSHILYLYKNKIPVYQINERNLAILEVDVNIVNVWDMLPDNLLKIPKWGTVNVHPSKLPQYRGAVPTLMSLKNHDSETAVSYMLLGATMDTGNILYQHPIHIDSNETALSLEVKILKALQQTFTKKILEYLNGQLKPFSQEEKLASYTPHHETYRLIDPKNETSEDILNKVFLYPYFEPDTFCYLSYKNEKIYIKKMNLYKAKAPLKMASIVGLKFVINAKTSTLYSTLFMDIPLGSSLKIIRTLLTK